MIVFKVRNAKRNIRTMAREQKLANELKIPYEGDACHIRWTTDGKDVGIIDLADWSGDKFYPIKDGDYRLYNGELHYKKPGKDYFAVKPFDDNQVPTAYIDAVRILSQIGILPYSGYYEDEEYEEYEEYEDL